MGFVERISVLLLVVAVAVSIAPYTALASRGAVVVRILHGFGGRADVSGLAVDIVDSRGAVVARSVAANGYAVLPEPGVGNYTVAVRMLGRTICREVLRIDTPGTTREILVRCPIAMMAGRRVLAVSPSLAPVFTRMHGHMIEVSVREFDTGARRKLVLWNDAGDLLVDYVSSRMMRLVPNAPSNTDSVTTVVGVREPVAVVRRDIGAELARVSNLEELGKTTNAWFYDPSTNTLYIKVRHHSPVEVEVVWSSHVARHIKLERTAALEPGDALIPHIYSLYLDGDNAYVYLGKPDFLAITSPIAIQTLIKPLTVDTTMRAVVSSTDSFGGSYELLYKSGNTYMYFWADGAAWLHSPDAPAENTWTHIAASADAANSLGAIYVNGSKTESYYSYPGSYSYVGVYIGYSPRLSTYAHGFVGYVLIYARTLTDSEVFDAYINYTVYADGMRLFFEPTVFNGTHFINLVNTSIAGRPSGGASRMLSDIMWIWLVKGLHSDGKIHLRFFPHGSVVRIYDDSTGELVAELTIDGEPNGAGLVEDYAVDLPSGVYRIEVEMVLADMYLESRAVYRISVNSATESFSADNTSTAGYEAVDLYTYRVWADPYDGSQNSASLTIDVVIHLPLNEAFVNNVTLLAKASNTGASRAVEIRVYDHEGVLVVNNTFTEIGTDWTQITLNIGRTFESSIDLQIVVSATSSTTSGEEVYVKDIRVYVESSRTAAGTIAVELRKNVDTLRCYGSVYVYPGGPSLEPQESTESSVLRIALPATLEITSISYPQTPQYIGVETVNGVEHHVYEVSNPVHEDAVTVVAELENTMPRIVVDNTETTAIPLGTPFRVVVEGMNIRTRVVETGEELSGKDYVEMVIGREGTYTLDVLAYDPESLRIGYAEIPITVMRGAASKECKHRVCLIRVSEDIDVGAMHLYNDVLWLENVYAGEGVVMWFGIDVWNGNATLIRVDPNGIAVEVDAPTGTKSIVVLYGVVPRNIYLDGAEVEPYAAPSLEALTNLEYGWYHDGYALYLLATHRSPHLWYVELKTPPEAKPGEPAGEIVTAITVEPEEAVEEGVYTATARMPQPEEVANVLIWIVVALAAAAAVYMVIRRRI